MQLYIFASSRISKRLALLVLGLFSIAACSGGATAGAGGGAVPANPDPGATSNGTHVTSSPSAGSTAPGSGPVASASASPSGTTSGNPSPLPTSASASTDDRSCLWTVEESPNSINTLYPDTNAYYFDATLPIPAGGDVRFDSEYPHGRYMSYNAYNPMLAPTDALTDFQISPNTGSTNVFLAGANRGSTSRNYSVRLVQQTAPTSSAMRAPNTLYGGAMLGTVPVSQADALIVYRVYVPDIGLDDTGGVGLPNITFELANGTKLTGKNACNYSVGNGLPNLNLVPDPITLLPVNSTGVYANLQWLKFFDTQQAEADRLYTTPLGPVAYETIGDPTSGTGGFASNVDNRYISASISESFGNVVAIRAQIPTTPSTYYANATMGSGDMRYLSLCSNDPNTLAVFACVYDEEITRDSQGRGVILVSKPADRPSNAYVACGVTWLDWGASDQDLLVLRNMLPLAQAQFPNAIQYVPGPPGSNEASVMGAFYPYGTHMQRTAFESLGCPVSASQLPTYVPQPAPTP